MPRFNNSSFDPRQDWRFVSEKGDWVEWLAARKCSCSDEADANRANPTCLVCSGTGTFWVAPVWIEGIVGSISNSRMLLESGIGLPGDLTFSAKMMDDSRLADRDILKLSDWDGGEAYEGELVRRHTASDSDRLIYDAMEITAVTRSDPDLGTITSYVENTDFVHATNSDTMVWTTNGVRPAVGSVYSVRYRPRFSYIVFTPPAERRERGTNLGQRVILKKRHLVLAAE
jgi:hypothetical protein